MTEPCFFDESVTDHILRILMKYQYAMLVQTIETEMVIQFQDGGSIDNRLRDLRKKGYVESFSDGLHGTQLFWKLTSKGWNLAKEKGLVAVDLIRKELHGEVDGR